MSKVKVSLEDLGLLQGWVQNYAVGMEGDPDFAEMIEWSERMSAWVEAEIERRINLSNIAEAKRAYAKEHNVPIKSLRIQKTA